MSIEVKSELITAENAKDVFTKVSESLSNVGVFFVDDIRSQGLSLIEAETVASIMGAGINEWGVRVAPAIDVDSLGDESKVSLVFRVWVSMERALSEQNNAVISYVFRNPNMAVVDVSTHFFTPTESNEINGSSTTSYDVNIIKDGHTFNSDNVFYSKEPAVAKAKELAKEGFDVSISTSSVSVFNAIGVERIETVLTVREITESTTSIPNQWYAMQKINSIENTKS